MEDKEIHKYIRFVVTILIILIIFFKTYSIYDYNQQLKGNSISNYLSHYHNIEIPPEQARYFNINVNQWEISIENLDVFGSWENGKGKRGKW
jgi:hypothetical protein